VFRNEVSANAKKRETHPVHAMKACREVEVQLHSFSPSELHVGEWTARGPGGLTPGGDAGTH
jgi:hypothetical protein